MFVSYGEKPSAQLLLSYGFIPKVGTNNFDDVPVTLSLNARDPLRAQKESLLRQYSLQSSETFPLRYQGWPTAMLPYAAFAYCRCAIATDSVNDAALQQHARHAAEPRWHGVGASSCLQQHHYAGRRLSS